MVAVIERLRERIEVWRLLPDISLRLGIVLGACAVTVIAFSLGILVGDERTANAGLRATGTFPHTSWSPDRLARAAGETAASANAIVPTERKFAATQSGEVYYPIDCKALGRVKAENRIWFANEKDAQDAGYRRAKNCR